MSKCNSLFQDRQQAIEEILNLHGATFDGEHWHNVTKEAKAEIAKLPIILTNGATK